MAHIRIVLAQMPRMLQEIVRTILSAEPDMEIDTSTVSEHEMASSEALRDADVVILGEAEARTDAYAAVLFAHPRLRFVAISDDRRGAVCTSCGRIDRRWASCRRERLVRAVRAQPAAEGRV